MVTGSADARERRRRRGLAPARRRRASLGVAPPLRGVAPIRAREIRPPPARGRRVQALRLRRARRRRARRDSHDRGRRSRSWRRSRRRRKRSELSRKSKTRPSGHPRRSRRPRRAFGHVSWAVAAEILAAWGAVAVAGRRAGGRDARAVRPRVAAACADELSSRGFSSRRGYSARRREGDGSNPPPGGRRSFEGLSADVSRLTSERVAALARASISAARQMARAYERDPDAASRALIPPKELYALCRARERSRRERGRGRGRNRRRGGLAEADAPGTLAEADALGTLALAEAEATADALALWALVLDGGGQPYREAFLPTQRAGASLSRGCSAGGGPTQNEIERFEVLSPNQPGFRPARALHARKGATPVWASATSFGAARSPPPDVAATAWTSFLDRGGRSTGATFAPLRRVARAHGGPSWTRTTRGGRIRRARAPKRRRVGALEDDALGRSTRAGSRRASERDPRAEMSRRDVADPRGGRPARRRRDADRAGGARGVRARRRRAHRRRGVRRETVARRTTLARGRRRGRPEAPPRRNRNRNRNRRRLKRRRRVVADPAWDPPRGGSRTFGGALRRRARSRGARVGLGGGRPRGDPRVDDAAEAERAEGRGTSFVLVPSSFSPRRRTRSRRRRRAFSRRASAASSFATRACGRGRGRRRGEGGGCGA